ncbi:aminoacyl-tRNA hydrolase [Kribbella sp. DT2]|uniref:aminoacyl-tRNA hydrolase n=1 Tax=Kribbella sp. DT2 TaxID=3393427 RepID=UPI003CE69115
MSGEGDVEYVLTLVLHVEKNDRPVQTDALETAARAVLAILADERSTGEGEWAEAMYAWQDARIRKVVRRARGIEWHRAEALPGITVSSAPPAPAGERPPPAEVRVFPPVPLDEVPKDLAKLQVTGTDLEDDDLPPVTPGAPVLWVNPTLEMSTGKTMAQVGHAAHLTWWALSDAARQAWADDDFRLAVRTASKDQWKQLLSSGLPVVQDAGFTEVEPGSRTVIADHPALR